MTAVAQTSSTQLIRKVGIQCTCTVGSKMRAAQKGFSKGKCSIAGVSFANPSYYDAQKNLTSANPLISIPSKTISVSGKGFRTQEGAYEQRIESMTGRDYRCNIRVTYTIKG